MKTLLLSCISSLLVVSCQFKPDLVRDFDRIGHVTAVKNGREIHLGRASVSNQEFGYWWVKYKCSYPIPSERENRGRVSLDELKKWTKELSHYEKKVPAYYSKIHREGPNDDDRIEIDYFKSPTLFETCRYSGDSEEFKAQFERLYELLDHLQVIPNSAF